ncbi:MAG: valine--tRNA ligase [Alphaproteobacteria bacterium]
MTELSEKYIAKIVEEKWQKYWQEKHQINGKTGVYSFGNDLKKEQTFVIDTPPPTVSGLLHMGHIFSYTQADFVARFQRMQGKDVFYPMGFDDNGLPTERLVEKIIGKKAQIFEAEEREKNQGGSGYFVAKCREVVEEAEQEFEELFKAIALSVDWSEKYQTISPQSQKISQASFVDLYNKGLIEKQLQPVFWDIADRTALSKADIIDREIEGEMHFINFTLDGQNQYLEIMTTRPELLSACVAVMISTESKIYKEILKKLISQSLAQKLEIEGQGLTGLFAITPIFGVKVPIIVDNDSVKADKGTGAVMCCTFGDETDLDWQRKYDLPIQEIINESGLIRGNLVWQSRIFDDMSVINEKIFLENFEKISGLKIKDAGKKTLELLREQNLLAKNSEKTLRPVKCAERSGMPIEIISTAQWFIKILPYKEQLKAKAKECSWYPDYMRVRIEQWIDGLSWDWCISRQRFFGVKIPVWYSQRKGEEGKILIASTTQLPCDPWNDLPEGYSREEVIGETDVLDTWATSSITPQLSSKGISSEICFDQVRHQKLFPADMRPQAHEIIRTWAFYTIVKAYLHSLEIVKDANGKIQKNQDGRVKLQENSNSNQTIPWQNLMISGWCLASDKTKMSKSKGNVITPKNLIEEKSADVVRYWASASSLGADIAYSEEVFKIGQKLITKIFNCAKFCSQHFAILKEHLVEKKIGLVNNEQYLLDLITNKSDQWILTKLQNVILQYNQQFEFYEYAKAREILEEFFWHYFCDNYLEICKVRSYGLSAEKYAQSQLTQTQKHQIIIDQLSALACLNLVLKNILKLFALYLPHLCEEIYSIIFNEEFKQKISIHLRGNKAHLPSQLKFSNDNILQLGEEILQIIFAVRKFKSENNLSMKTSVSLIEISSKHDISAFINDLENVCNAQKISLGANQELVKVIL